MHGIFDSYSSQEAGLATPGIEEAGIRGRGLDIVAPTADTGRAEARSRRSWSDILQTCALNLIGPGTGVFRRNVLLNP
ncbi:hypothetical protein RRF57_000119 [Xylaria bambusicola]|uniref:Uncharacterized protein n=1 Tax=Xylaria bambusicola TaxID=326684 RepID=A0AAN7U9N3_9PEZI